MGLVLDRQIGQAVTVDGPAVIRVVRITGKRTKLYVEAPSSTLILREELSERKREEEKR